MYIVTSDTLADVTNAKSPCGVFLLMSRPADVKFFAAGELPSALWQETLLILALYTVLRIQFHRLLCDAFT